MYLKRPVYIPALTVLWWVTANIKMSDLCADLMKPLQLWGIKNRLGAFVPYSGSAAAVNQWWKLEPGIHRKTLIACLLVWAI